MSEESHVCWSGAAAAKQNCVGVTFLQDSSCSESVVLTYDLQDSVYLLGQY